MGSFNDVLPLNDITTQLSTLNNLTSFTASARIFRADGSMNRITPVPSVRVLRFDDCYLIRDKVVPDMDQFVRAVSLAFPNLERIFVPIGLQDQSVIVEAATRLGVELGTYFRHY